MQLTPMMTQYIEVKTQYNDCLVFYRMGDFYELFFNDAIKASKILNITLTKRGTCDDGKDIPMCGVPYHSADTYIATLVKNGEKIAICEQMETPQEAKKRGYKAVVRREVVKIITAGTLTQESLLNNFENNYLMAVFINEKEFKKNLQNASINEIRNHKIIIHFSVIDISTQDFFLNSIPLHAFWTEYLKFNPKEILMPEFLYQSNLKNILKQENNAIITSINNNKFNHIREHERLLEYFNVKTIESFGFTNESQYSVCGAVIDYIHLTQKCENFLIKPPQIINNSKLLIIDANTIQNLEIIKSSGYSLLNIINKTVTACGFRLLNKRILTPIIDIDTLNNRLNIVEFYKNYDQTHTNKDNQTSLKNIINLLKNIPDVERSLARINFNNTSPKDLLLLRNFLIHIINIHKQYQNLIIENQPNSGKINQESLFWINEFEQFYALKDLLIQTLNDLPNIGDIIKIGYSKELDNLKNLKNNHENIVIDLQNTYITNTGIKKLKIKFNNILGYYIEIPLSQQSLITYEFIHKQTLINCARYKTSELEILESKLSQVQIQIEELENHIYLFLLNEIKNFSHLIKKASEHIALLDLSVSFAYLAIEKNYTRPIFFNDNRLKIIQARHPIIETYVDFTANNCILDESNIMLLTGPNMSGKSTFLRQNAIIILLAQIGCFVPAQEAEIGIVDKLFSRIGAYDEIAKGRSTFMVEMIETATIINNATKSSFIILDEVGRGTSTFDGLSIAWAVLENLYFENKSRTLFATHFHELIKIKNIIPNIILKTLKIQETLNDVVFFHNIIDGYTDKSYGIHVAKLAGVPEKLITRAVELLQEFENNKNTLICNISKDNSKKTQPQYDQQKNSTAYNEVNKEYDKKKIQNESEIEYIQEFTLNNDYQNTKEIILNKKQYENYLTCAKLLDYIKNKNINDITPKQAHDILYGLCKCKILN